MYRRLVGTWVRVTGNDESLITYSKDHRYSKKSGRHGFPTGFYSESGAWEIVNGDSIQLIPEDRKSGIRPTDKQLFAEFKTYEKAMDEGAWKPMPTKVSFVNDNTFSTPNGLGGKPIIYRRVP